MRPYLAIIKDSFRESLASRVLWVLLGLITLVLIALAPIGWTRHDATGFRQDEIRDVRKLAEELAQSQSEPTTSARRYVWDSLNEGLRKRLTDFRPTDRRSFEEVRLADRVAEDLSRLVGDDQFYRADLWNSVEWNSEGKRLHEETADATDSVRQERLRRLFIESVFPGQFKPAPREAVLFTYAGWDIGLFPAVPESQAIKITETATMGFMSFFIGFVGTLAAILVTASIIPQTFASGTIYLLLSKPIARPLLFLSKFVGSCSFVVICASYLITGLWLILGIRLQIWKPQLLFAIPIFLFLFCIYYSVSALAGLVWRSTVMAIVTTVIFWFVCTVVGTSKDLIELLGIRPQRLTEVVAADDEWFGFRQNGEVVRWNATAAQWIPAFNVGERQEFGPMMNRRQLLQLLYDKKNERILALKRQWPQPRIFVGRKQDDWLAVDTAAAPRETNALYLEPDGRIIALAADGAYRLAETLRPAEAGVNVFGFQIPAPAPKNYERVTGVRRSAPSDKSDAPSSPPTDAPTDEPSAAQVPPKTQDATTQEEQAVAESEWPSGALVTYAGGAIWLYQDNHLSVWRRTKEGDYRENARRQIDQAFIPTMMAATNHLAFLADENGRSMTVSFGETKDRSFERAFNAPATSAAISPDQRWLAILYVNDRLWLYDLKTDRDWTGDVPRQGQISGFAFSQPDRLAVADARGVVQLLSLPDLAVEQTFAPRLSILERIYWYAIRPLYLVFPKPKQLANTTDYLLTGKETESVEMGPPGSGTIHVQLDPWTPVWTSSLFVIAVLGIGCVYMQRQEF